MSIPKRHSSSENILSGPRTFFVTTATDGKRALLQSERSATLLINVMFHYRDQGEYKLHDFVVMRNHFHAQITLGEDKSVERAMQLIKGGFSYRARKELSMKRTIWQRGFSEDQVTAEKSSWLSENTSMTILSKLDWRGHQRSIPIHQLIRDSRNRKPQRLKPDQSRAHNGTAPLRSSRAPIRTSESACSSRALMRTRVNRTRPPASSAPNQEK